MKKMLLLVLLLSGTIQAQTVKVISGCDDRLHLVNRGRSLMSNSDLLDEKKRKANLNRLLDAIRVKGYKNINITLNDLMEGEINRFILVSSGELFIIARLGQKKDPEFKNFNYYKLDVSLKQQGDIMSRKERKKLIDKVTLTYPKTVNDQKVSTDPFELLMYYINQELPYCAKQL